MTHKQVHADQVQTPLFSSLQSRCRVATPTFSIFVHTSDDCTALFVLICIYVRTDCVHVFLCVCLYRGVCVCVSNSIFSMMSTALSQTSSARYGCSICLSAANRWIQVTQKHIQLAPTEILVWLKRVSGDNPVFLDPLTSRHLVVLARSWSCQPSIYGRSVFNLQERTLPEYRARMKKREGVGELKPVLLSLCLSARWTCVSQL